MKKETINRIKHFDDNVCLGYYCVGKKTDVVIQTTNLFNKLNTHKLKLAIPIQKHTNNVAWTKGGGVYKDCDGIASNLNYNIMLSLSVADCVPVCMFDPVTKNFALVHSGWRGTYKKISNKAVSLLINNKSNASNIIVYCGVSISSKNYEVDSDVASLFLEKNIKSNGSKFLLDIKSQIEDDLVSIGVDRKNIFSTEECTYDNKSLPSFRRDGENAGRITFFMGRRG